ncbi:MAG: glycosyltransferase [Nitrosopumilus sp.]|nr:glycosyltransferase [Nitrosopumilus sp.]
MRLLIGAGPNRLRHVGILAAGLERLGVTCMVADDDPYEGYPGGDLASWPRAGARFGRLVSGFEPDVIMADRIRGFAARAVASGIPTVVHLRGDYWEEMRLAFEESGVVRRAALGRRAAVSARCLEGAAAIMPICTYLERTAAERLPNSRIAPLQNYLDVDGWPRPEPMDLRHPCVGLLQHAVSQSKSGVMADLADAIRDMPDVTFYWAGTGKYSHRVRDALGRFPNFVELGRVQYPDGAAAFLAGIDVYALITELEMSPSSILEAQLSGKPVLGSDVYGVPDVMADGETGFLVGAGDRAGWSRRIRQLLDDPDLASRMGEAGRKFVLGSFGVEKRAAELAKILESVSRPGRR